MKDKNIFKDQKRNKIIQSPTRLLLFIIFSIIVSNILVLVLSKVIPSLTLWIDLFIDSVLVAIILFPSLYFLVFRPQTRIIAERKLAHEEILKLHAAVESSGEAIFITDPEGLITYINPEFTNLYGYTAGEVVGKTTPRILKSGVMSSEIYKNFWDAILNKEEVRGEHINKTKDGRLITVEGSANPVLNDQNEIIMFIAIQHDITMRKQTEENLATEQYLINALFDNIPDHIYFKDLESRFIRVNKAQSVFLGLKDPAEAIGKTDFDFFTGYHAKEAFADEQNIIRNGQLLSKEEKETHKDRPDTWVSTIKLPLRDKKGNIVGTFGISKDITRRKNLEDSIHIKQLMLETIIENIPDQVYYKDRNSKFVICNNTVALLAGCTSDKDLIGKSDFDFHPLHLAQQYFNDEQSLMEKGQKFLDHEEPILNKTTGELSWNLSSKVPVKDSEGKVIGLVGINRDISDRKKAEEEIKLKNELLQIINAEKDKFFSIIAHDLRGPLSAFVSATKILTEDIGTMSPEEVREIILAMKNDAENVYSLLENLLEWSRIKRGIINFNPVNISLLSKITDSISLVLDQAKKKNIAIHYSIAPDLEIHADVHMFETVIRNFVSNAIKFTPSGGEITISAARTPDNSIEIRVRDTGIGMSSELAGKLFKLNEKTSRTGTEGEPSSGLGLFLCKEFIEKHNGKIKVESEEGKGSTFSFTI